MKKVYDRDEAAKLIPLLRSITREIEDRTSAIASLEATVAESRLPKSSPARDDRDSFAKQAELANQRRELRLAKQELARLGCTLDLDHPLRVLIPGDRVGVERGFTWSNSDTEPQPIQVVTTS
jgi:hypothetical protein